MTNEINQLEKEISALVERLAPTLLAVCGCGALTAAKILGETAGVSRFRSNDAYARHNGTAPLPVWSSNRARHRLSRRGNRQLKAALRRIALTQAHYHPGARVATTRKMAIAASKQSGSSRDASPTSSTRRSSPPPATLQPRRLDSG